MWYPIWKKKNDLNKKNINIISEIVHNKGDLNIEFQYIKAHTNLKDQHSIGNHTADGLARISINKI